MLTLLLALSGLEGLALSGVEGLALSGVEGPLAFNDPPNIVYLLADDLGWADVGWHRGEIPTPNLDALAAAGAKLEAFYVQPVCSPTRAALLTGRYPMRHGLQVGVVRPWARHGLPLEERTIADALREAGYATSICGKWHLGHAEPAYLPTRRGFDHQYGPYNGAIDYFTHDRDGGFDWHRNDAACRDEGYATHLLAREAAQVVRTHAGKKPFFLYVAFNAVHSPHQAPEKYMEPFAALKGERRKYAGMLAAMDEAVGTIVEAVDAAGLRERTLFIFSSDNGGPAVASNGPLRAGKGTLYEGGVRVPAFASWKGRIPTGSVVEQPLHVVDWYPTLLKLAGARLDQALPLDGRDAWATIAQGAASPHDDLLLNTEPGAGAIRAGDWKLVVEGTSAELFNLKDDPFEKKDRAAENPGKARELRERLDAYARQATPPKGGPKPKNFVSPKVWGE